MGQVVVETTNLTKTYGSFTAVSELNLCIEEGEIYGFLGPNGAGKTTTILMLLGLTEPTSGTAAVCGYDPVRAPLQVKRLVGYLPENVGFYEDLTARQNLEYIAELNNLPREETRKKIDNLLAVVGLPKAADQRVGEFSHGMKQRLGIADMLVKDPKLVFLDEPTSGIDPKGIAEILDLIVKLAKRKVTVIFCSHQLAQVQRICSRVGIMAKGKLVAEGALAHLGGETGKGGRYRIEVQVTKASHDLVAKIKENKDVVEVKSVSADSLIVVCKSDLRSQIAKVVVDSGSSLVGMKVEEASLEKIYKKCLKEG